MELLVLWGYRFEKAVNGYIKQLLPVAGFSVGFVLRSKASHVAFFLADWSVTQKPYYLPVDNSLQEIL